MNVKTSGFADHVAKQNVLGTRETWKRGARTRLLNWHCCAENWLSVHVNGVKTLKFKLITKTTRSRWKLNGCAVAVMARGTESWKQREQREVDLGRSHSALAGDSSLDLALFRLLWGHLSVNQDCARSVS